MELTDLLTKTVEKMETKEEEILKDVFEMSKMYVDAELKSYVMHITTDQSKYKTVVGQDGRIYVDSDKDELHYITGPQSQRKIDMKHRYITSKEKSMSALSRYSDYLEVLEQYQTKLKSELDKKEEIVKTYLQKFQDKE
ncbi:hypothetical protein K9L97_03180 [Candidatus Woesearchaeota archaeon]|nr:hypothetical protein [Candidatus Woesearchaeota archaeon]